jgi:DNA (cytosine-5)-methyltransferase 1
MQDPAHHDRPLRAGSLFSGYGGLDLAIEHTLGAETIWFSEINKPVARIFAHHWPDALNLGDITTIDWLDVEPVDVLCGGFPCQDVSTVGKRAGLAPGTRSGLWSYMAATIEALRPRLVVIENVRGLLSSPAIRVQAEGDDDAHHNPDDATPNPATLRNLESDPWGLGDSATRPLRAAGAVLGDLADLGMDAQWIGLPASLVGAPHTRFRIFILAQPHIAVQDPARDRLDTWRRKPGSSTSTSRHDRTVPSDHRPRPSRTTWLAQQEHRIGDPVEPDPRHLHCWGRYAAAVARWEHITGREAPAPALLNEDAGPRPAPEFVEWLMGLPAGWVTDSGHGLTRNQQITALGNGVLPLHATRAIQSTMDSQAGRMN